MVTASESHPPLRRTLLALLTAAALLAVTLLSAMQAHAAADYTQSVTGLGTGSVRVSFTPATPSALVDIHYLRYTAAVGTVFKPLENSYRITAPRSSITFLAGGAQAGYLQATGSTAHLREQKGLRPPLINVTLTT